MAHALRAPIRRFRLCESYDMAIITTRLRFFNSFLSPQHMTLAISGLFTIARV